MKMLNEREDSSFKRDEEDYKKFDRNIYGFLRGFGFKNISGPQLQILQQYSARVYVIQKSRLSEGKPIEGLTAKLIELSEMKLIQIPLEELNLLKKQEAEIKLKEAEMKEQEGQNQAKGEKSIISFL